MYDLLLKCSLHGNFSPIERSHTIRFSLNRITPRLSLLLGLVLCSPSVRAATLSATRTAFPDSVKAVAGAPAPQASSATIKRTVLGADERAASMPFEVSLRMRNFDEMQARIARGELISDSEKQARYFPLAADHDRVVKWLEDQGLEVTRTDGNRLGVFGRGSVDAVAAAFGVAFARVTAADGLEFTSAVTAPSLPNDLSPAVLGIHGLQPHIRRRVLSTPRLAGAAPRINIGAGYLPAAIAAAYNAGGLGVDGTGQTIAIYAFAYPALSDLTQFWSAAGVSQTVSNVTMIDVAGGPSASPDPNAVDEVALDVEWAGALAPGAAIRVYGVSELDPAENDEIFQQVYADLPSQPNMHVFSVSIGGNELDVPRDYLIIEAQYVANLASAGVTILVASGDNGATTNNSVQTTYPTSDPDVTGVGGTTLNLQGQGAGSIVTSESGWTDSGGGTSMVFSRPAWQTGTGVPQGTMRCVPDVASAADPQEGAEVIVGGSAITVGGTSWSAPTWAAWCALINQKRGTPLGLLNPKIYPLLGSTSFRDITSGSNGAYSAGVGYDLVTGIGVPDVTALMAASLTSSSAANITSQFGNLATTIGQPATFFVVGAGAPPLTFQWERMPGGSTAWTNLADNGTYGGSGTPKLVVSAATAAMSGDQFRCVVSNAGGSATSTPESLTVSTVGVTTLAGWPGSSGSADGTGWDARFALAGGLRTDSQGNIYASDSENYTIRKVTPAGVVTTVAGTPRKSGSTDGPVASALFSGVGGVAVNAEGTLYVADSGNYTIRKIEGGVVSTLAGVAGTRGEVDGTGSSARLYDPQNLALDSAGNIYVADGMGFAVRKITPDGVVTTLAGSPLVSGSSDGTGAAAQFNDITGITVDPSGNIFVADYGNNTVRKVTPAGVVTTVAGLAGVTGSKDGTGVAASFNGPAGVGSDSSGNIYVSDSGNDLIRVMNPAGFVSTAAGVTLFADDVDGQSSNARFNTSGDVCVDNSGIVYVADAGNSTIRRIIPGVDSSPFFTAQPASQAVTLGSNATFTMGISGTAPFAFQWYFNGAPISGATTPSYTAVLAQPAAAGTYTVTVTNTDLTGNARTVTSAPATLTVNVPAGSPAISAQPQGGPLAPGGSVELSVTASGAGLSYQWMLNGSAIAGATGSTYAATAAGRYTVAITNSVATLVSDEAIVGSVNRLTNISTRALVGTGASILIPGLYISGSGTETLLIRGDGPALTQYGVTGVLAQPTLSVFDSAGTLVASNSGWGTNASAPQIVTVSAQVGAFPLASGSGDCALIANLSAGAYTVQISGMNSTTGVALAEVYEVSSTGSARLANISTRATVGTGGNILIPGFYIAGSGSEKLLIRADGPALTQYGVTGVLAQPTLSVFNSAGTMIASNTGWGTGTDAAQVPGVAASVGAFPFTAGSADSALIVDLQPGGYTIQITGVGGTKGVSLAEIYEVAQ